MSREYDRRAAILESLRAGKSPSQIVQWFGYKKTQVYDLAKKFKEADNEDNVSAVRATHSRRSDCKRNEEFVANLKETINEDPGQSMSVLATKMDVARSTVSLAVREDLGFKSYAFRNRQLLTEKNKMDRKLKAHALLNNMKHDSAGFLRFFSDEKNFIQDRKVNRQNDRWICQDSSEVPTVMHNKFPASVMVLSVISDDGDVMPPHFFESGLKVNSEEYIEVLKTVVKPWMDGIAAGRNYVFQQDSAPAHKARKTQAWLYDNLPYHWSPDLWPPSSPDCNPLDYYLWGVVEGKVNHKFYNTLDALKTSIFEVMTNMDKEEVKRACGKFRSRLEKVVAADGGYIE